MKIIAIWWMVETTRNKGRLHQVHDTHLLLSSRLHTKQTVPEKNRLDGRQKWLEPTWKVQVDFPSRLRGLTELDFTNFRQQSEWVYSPYHNSHSTSVIRCVLVPLPPQWTQIFIQMLHEWIFISVAHLAEIGTRRHVITDVLYGNWQTDKLNWATWDHC